MPRVLLGGGGRCVLEVVQSNSDNGMHAGVALGVFNTSFSKMYSTVFNDLCNTPERVKKIREPQVLLSTPPKNTTHSGDVSRKDVRARRTYLKHRHQVCAP